MTRDELRALCEERLRLAEKATPGPWIAVGSDVDGGKYGCDTVIGLEDRGHGYMSDKSLVLGNADRALIVHAGAHDLALMRAVLELLEEKPDAR